MMWCPFPPEADLPLARQGTEFVLACESPQGVALGYWVAHFQRAFQQAEGLPLDSLG